MWTGVSELHPKNLEKGKIVIPPRRNFADTILTK
jgi:hypothetical protein